MDRRPRALVVLQGHLRLEVWRHLMLLAKRPQQMPPLVQVPEVPAPLVTKLLMISLALDTQTGKDLVGGAPGADPLKHITPSDGLKTDPLKHIIPMPSSGAFPSAFDSSKYLRHESTPSPKVFGDDARAQDEMLRWAHGKADRVRP